MGSLGNPSTLDFVNIIVFDVVVGTARHSVLVGIHCRAAAPRQNMKFMNVGTSRSTGSYQLKYIYSNIANQASSDLRYIGRWEAARD